MTKILAISGGIDSMVMLDIFRQDDIVVANFNHGTRPSADNDAEFVAYYARDYHLPITLGSADLGEDVSEETARRHRYNFLREVSRSNHAKIYTAHHLDDLVESIAINLLRGTGWRGLAVLDTPGIVRPFLTPEILDTTKPWGKKEILKYATKHRITFRQDPTNCEDKYLRNRIRRQLQAFDQPLKIYHLWQKQKQLRQAIDQLVYELLPAPDEPWQRSWFQNLDETVALELLRAGTLRAGISATRPQLKHFLHAIRTYAPGTYFNLPGDKLVKLSKTAFIL